MKRSAAILAALLASTALVDAQVEVRTDEFRLVADLEADTARRAAEHLRRMAHRLAEAGYRSLEASEPLTVVLLGNVVDLAPYLFAGEPAELARPKVLGRGRGLSFHTSDGAYILLSWNAPGSPWTALAHEYAHLIDPDRERPPWLSEGRAEVLARMIDGGPEGAVDAASHGYLQKLGTAPWIPFGELLSAFRGGTTAHSELFYPQSWLLTHWLAHERQEIGADSVALLDQKLTDPLEELRSAGGDVDQLEPILREYLVELRGRDSLERPLPSAEQSPAARPLEPWEAQYWKAELLRVLEQWSRARRQLVELSEQYPGEPLIEASLGALAMDRGRNQEAERRLTAGAQSSDALPRTHHRLALLLLHPAAEASGARERAERAVVHAELAVGGRPGDPRFVLTLAQSYLVAERWDDAARTLRSLERSPEWRARAATEFAELERRRRQAVRAIPAPELATQSGPQEAYRPALAAVAEPKLDAATPAPPRRRPAWPPRGASILVGKIATVDCTGDDRIIVLRGAVTSVRFRDSGKRPAALLFPPLKWDRIPCGTYGWTVNIAYRPLRGVAGVHGEAVAILF